MKKTAYVITTINNPVSLEGYCKQINFYNHKNIDFYVVGDLKTPKKVSDYCKKLQEKYDINITYFNPEFLDKMVKLYNIMDMYPPNDANRRTLGMIHAYFEGYETIIVGDDDNFVTGHDFFRHHNIVGEKIEIPLIESSNGWYNVCGCLEEKNDFYF